VSLALDAWPPESSKIGVPPPASFLRVRFEDEPEAKPQRKLGIARMIPRLKRRTWEAIAAVLAIVAAISFSVGWITARRDGRTDVPVMSATQNEPASEPITSVPHPPAGPIARPPNDAVGKAPLPSRQAVASRAPSDNNVASFATKDASPEREAPAHARPPAKTAAAPSPRSELARQSETGPAPAMPEAEIAPIPAGEVS